MLFLLSLVAVAVANPIQLATKSNYDDTLARSKFLPYSAAAYSSTPQKCFTNLNSDTKVKRLVSVICDKTMVDHCTGYVAVSHNDQAIIIAYRGTDRNVQLLEEADQTIFQAHTPWSAGGNVSKYFADGFEKTWSKGIKDDFTSYANQYPTYKLYVTGHSLGGALAVLAASYISHNNLFPKDQITLTTFGEPRVGNQGFIDSVDYELPNSFRVVHHKDMVPHLPLKNEEGYLQHKTEIYYPKDMKVGDTYKTCKSDESMLCSDGNIVDYSIKDHLHYFDVDVSEYGVTGCKTA